LATPNYGYEKRQRELAKKKKKEEKARAKAAGKSHGDQGSDDAPGDVGDQNQAQPSSNLPGSDQPG
jgi:hypothetical protein